MSHDHMQKVGNRCLYARNLIELAEAIGVSLFEIRANSNMTKAA